MDILVSKIIIVLAYAKHSKNRLIGCRLHPATCFDFKSILEVSATSDSLYAETDMRIVLT